MLTCKDILLLILGTLVGFFFSVGIYWAPLGQLFNELKAVWNLCRHRYNRGDTIQIRGGTTLYPLNVKQDRLLFIPNKEMKIWHDEGINWHHTDSGWIRARIVHIFNPEEKGIPSVYKACHLDII